MKNYEDVDSWKTIMFLYNSALKEVGTKLEILNDEFQHVHKYNPIEHIKTRIKTPESIVKKLRRYGYEISIENMVKYINDIAGVRLICSFTSDIYRLAVIYSSWPFHRFPEVLSMTASFLNSGRFLTSIFNCPVGISNPFPRQWDLPRSGSQEEH